ncbi:hypothetical protein FACS1894162_3170 [Bacteroidia bacterium]|nr:hypothetical protein FACS1894162_3170 [Bacteroidia bacterium]
MKYIANFLSLLLIAVACYSCADEATGNATTYQEDLVTAFLEKQPEVYSEFLGLMNEIGMNDLLNAYGNYTCFVPNNEAMLEYYASQGWSSAADMSVDEKRELLFNHIVSGKSAEDIYTTARFPQARLEIANMNNRFIPIHSTVDTINNIVQIYAYDSPIIIKDQMVHNGVIHTLGSVLTAVDVNLPGVLAADGRFSFFSRALMETGLADSLKLSNNDAYDEIRKAVDPAGLGIVVTSASQNGVLYPTPPVCFIKFTALVESDDTYKSALTAAGLRPVYEDLIEYAKRIYNPIYPSDAGIIDITDRRNSFNRFIAYHLLDRSIYWKEFLFEKRIERYVPGYLINQYSEFIETMCPNTLLEVKPIASYDLNIPVFNRRADFAGVSIKENYCDKEADNGLYHEIDKVLTYAGMENELLNKRIRMDATLLLPELQTNGLRNNIDKSGGNGWVFPHGYFKNLTYTEETVMEYWGTQDTDLDGEELLFCRKYDLTLRLPPVPAGTYEVRIGYTANTTGRGVAQIFFDGKPCGIPLNLKVNATDASIGSKSDADLKTPELIAENDKEMRNRGYMKGPAGSICTYSTPAGAQTLRNYSGAIRRIVFTGTFDKAEPHYLRVRNVEQDLSREFMIDYIEYAPKAIWEGEDKN